MGQRKCWLAFFALHHVWAEYREEVVSVKPLVIVMHNFANASECQGVLDLIERCHRHEWDQCHDQRSTLHNRPPNSTSSAGHHRQGHPWRNSTSFTLGLQGEINVAVDSLVRRSHLFARHPVTYGEGVQIASYHPGDYYEFHHDSLMRRATVLLYLTDIPEGDGGETIFPLVRAKGVSEDAVPPLPPAVRGHKRVAAGFKVEHMEEMLPYCESDFYLKIRPEAGKAILFFSYGPDYSMDEYAIHGACPVRRGHKAIFQRWMRF